MIDRPSRSRPAIRAVFAALAAVLTPLTGPAAAQTLVHGRVVEATTGRPIPSATLRLIDSGGDTVRTAQGDEGAAFRMEVDEAGNYSLSVQRVGYTPLHVRVLRVGGEEEMELEIRLAARAVPLDPLLVVARRGREPLRLREFRRRAESRALGGGRFYLREELERLPPFPPRRLLDTFLSSSECRPTILLDGMRDPGPLNGMSVNDLAGVEIYRDPLQIPAEFFRPGMCALAVFWTRSDAPDARPLSWKRLGIVGALVALAALVIR